MSEELGAVVRWYIALPPIFLVGIVVGLFFIAIAGQARLNSADERVHDSEIRERALNEFAALLTATESEQRGFLLTGDPAYSEAYTAAAAGVLPALDRIAEVYRPLAVQSEAVGKLRVLAEQRLAEFQHTLNKYQKQGRASLDLVGTGVAQKTAESILDISSAMHRRESTEFAAATRQWQSDVRSYRWITTGGEVLNIGLLILSIFILYGEMQRRAGQAADLLGQKKELAQQVRERTVELTALSTHLQGVSEQEKSALSRELHDELGGLLVAARMDLSWLQQHLPTGDPAIEQRFKRIHESLSAGVDLKRRVVEELRPTLLDNMGLYTALRWQFKESCRRAGLRCTETIPEVELKFSPNAAIGVFRVAQEALMNILKHADARCADLTLDINAEQFTLRITDDGRGIPANRVTNTAHGLSSMRHRISALGGLLEISAGSAGGTVVSARIPMSAMLLQNENPAVNA